MTKNLAKRNIKITSYEKLDVAMLKTLPRTSDRERRVAANATVGAKFILDAMANLEKGDLDSFVNCVRCAAMFADEVKKIQKEPAR